MKIIHTPQYDFHNVLIRPKRTTISSRSQVDLEREIPEAMQPRKIAINGKNLIDNN